MDVTANMLSEHNRRRTNLLIGCGLASVLVVLGRFALFDYGPASAMFHPHGYCYLWMPDLVAAHVISDMLIGVSYVAISGTLVLLVVKARVHQSLPFSWVFVAFGVFIIACGATHFMEILTLWQPLFWLSADVKIVTALASVVTAVVLPPLVPKVLTLLQAAALSDERRLALEQAHAELEHRIQERTQELQAALQRAEEANRAREIFLGTVSHELRTPLNAIVGWAGMLTRQADDPAFIRRGIAVIDRNAKLQTELIEDLLDYSRVASGTLRLQVEAIDLVRIVADVVDAIRPSAQGRQLSLTLHPTVDRLSLAADPKRLQQVVWNLLTNAVKFTPEGGAVDVRIERAADDARISVRDTGIGIPDEFRPHLFEQFARADSASTRATSGMGLGLAITRELVHLHGGRIHAESAGPGRGTVFTVAIPITAATIDNDRRLKPSRFIARIEGLRVLVVDDHRDALDAAALILGQAGATVVSASSVREAILSLQAEPFDIVVSDVAMPVEDGYDLIARIHEDPILRTIPVVAVSAYARGEDRDRSLRAGFAAHVAKPVTPEDLIHCIGSVVGL